MLVAVGWKIAECIAAKWKPDSIMAAPILTSMQAQTRGWKGLKSIGQAITTTTAKDGTETSEVRYYTNSIQPKVKLLPNPCDHIGRSRACTGSWASFLKKTRAASVMIEALGSRQEPVLCLGAICRTCTSRSSFFWNCLID